MKVAIIALCAVFCSSGLLCKAATPEGAFSVKLSKKPLQADRIIEQRQALAQKQTLKSTNQGEDIPLVDFLDAQVSLLIAFAYFSSGTLACVVILRCRL